ncbi:GDSL lipase/acylhydrolase family protein [Peziza echinospora]|nr:GDSL lipase/acylhydrolase family protein [Peziza echinospora]
MKTQIVFALLALGIHPVIAHEPVYGRGQVANYKNKNHNFRASKSGWSKVKNLVAFGDSYTDESRLGYFGEHGGAPPIGWEAPANNVTASGGKSWARIVAESSGVKLYNYAVSGAVCSNLNTPRLWDSINAPFPSVAEYEVPTYLTEHTNKRSGALDLDPSETAYSLWIGTNDLGGNAYLSDEHLPGFTLADYNNCVFEQIKTLYKEAGARYFILQNNVPLDRSPLYTDGSIPGSAYIPDSRFWAQKSAQFGGNGTRIAEKIKTEVLTTNQVQKYRAIAAIFSDELPGASIALYDTHGLISDIIKSPKNYLTGPAPLNVTGMNVHCADATWSACTTYRPNDLDSFVWYDELHPSRATWKVVAGEIVNVFKGKTSKWITVLTQ